NERKHERVVQLRPIASTPPPPPAQALLRAPQRALELARGGEPLVTFTDLIQYFRARFGVEEGQTMAEYGVVLAVITALVVLAIGTLSGAISAALDKVTSYL